MRRLILLLLLFFTACKPDVSVRGKEYNLVTETGLVITLGFDAHTDRYFGKAVNRYFGKYQASRNKMMFTPPASTMKMGPEDDMMAEEKYFNDLSHVKSYQITDKNLILVLSDNSTLHFMENSTTFETGETAK